MSPPRIGSAASHSAPVTTHSTPRTPPPSHSAAPRSTPPHRADTFSSSDHARDGALRHATGRGYDEQVTHGTAHASQVASRPVDFSHPEQTLRDHSQLDASSRTTADQDRCGATALVGGLVLSGDQAPQRLHDARARVQSRLGEVESGLRAGSDRTAMEPPNPLAERPAYAEGLHEAAEARRMLAGLPDSPHSTWTHQQLSQFEEASYHLGRAEQALHGEPMSEAGLTGTEMVRLRDTVWGQGWQPHTSDGHPVDVVFAGQRERGGTQFNHFVLGTDDVVAEGRRALVYDPWPRDDGSAFARSPSDAPTLLGGALESGRMADGSVARAGEDLDAWRRLADREGQAPTFDQQLEQLTSRP